MDDPQYPPVSFEQASDASKREYDQRERWIRVLGEAVLAFGQLEWISHWVYRAVNNEPVSRTFARDSLQERNKKALAMLRDRLLPPGKADHPMALVRLCDDWRTFFDEIGDVCDPRNDIVHNPLSFDIWRSPDGTFHVASGIELLRKDGRPMLIEEVEKHCAAFRRLGGVMLQLRGETAYHLLPDVIGKESF